MSLVYMTLVQLITTMLSVLPHWITVCTTFAPTACASTDFCCHMQSSIT